MKTPIFSLAKKTTQSKEVVLLFHGWALAVLDRCFAPGVVGVEAEWAEGRRTEEKAQEKPCANVNKRRTNYQTVTSELHTKKIFIGPGTHRGSGGNAFIPSEHNIPGLKHRLLQ